MTLNSSQSDKLNYGIGCQFYVEVDRRYGYCEKPAEYVSLIQGDPSLFPSGIRWSSIVIDCSFKSFRHNTTFPTYIRYYKGSDEWNLAIIELVQVERS